ncbi:MAG: hypothetical protein ACKO6N_11310 [Myxococcota bacterium]
MASIPPTPPMKAVFTNTDGGPPLTVLLNPNTLSIKRKASWTSKPVLGMPYPSLQFSGGGSDELSLELMLDATETPTSVLDAVKTIYSWTISDPKLGRPPVILFTWGELAFGGVVEDFDVKFKLFDDTRAPRRAEVSIDLEGVAFQTNLTPLMLFEVKPETITPSAGG